jgi:hypothetical protein
MVIKERSHLPNSSAKGESLSERSHSNSEKDVKPVGHDSSLEGQMRELSLAAAALSQSLTANTPRSAQKLIAAQWETYGRDIQHRRERVRLVAGFVCNEGYQAPTEEFLAGIWPKDQGHDDFAYAFRTTSDFVVDQCRMMVKANHRADVARTYIDKFERFSEADFEACRNLPLYLMHSIVSEMLQAAAAVHDWRRVSGLSSKRT